MKSSDLLSICVPTYNRPDLLKRNLISVAKQATPEVEIIISDDSEDLQAKRVVDEINQTYNLQIVYHRNDYSEKVLPEAKQALNVNKLIEMASGKFIYILHDDDYILDNGISFIVSELKKYGNSYKVFVFGVKITSLNGKVRKTQKVSRNRKIHSDEALKMLTTDSSFIRTPGIIINKEAYYNVGLYDEKVQLPIDFDMWMRIFPHYNLIYSRYIVACYTEHMDNLTSRVFNQKYLYVLMNIFEKLRAKKLLRENELLKNQSLFLHQWILAGVYRNLRFGRIRQAKEIFSLFNETKMQSLPVAYKWLPLKWIFRSFFVLSGH